MALTKEQLKRINTSAKRERLKPILENRYISDYIKTFVNNMPKNIQDILITFNIDKLPEQLQNLSLNELLYHDFTMLFENICTNTENYLWLNNFSSFLDFYDNWKSLSDPQIKLIISELDRANMLSLFDYPQKMYELFITTKYINNDELITLIKAIKDKSKIENTHKCENFINATAKKYLKAIIALQYLNMRNKIQTQSEFRYYIASIRVLYLCYLSVQDNDKTLLVDATLILYAINLEHLRLIDIHEHERHKQISIQDGELRLNNWLKDEIKNYLKTITVTENHKWIRQFAYHILDKYLGKCEEFKARTGKYRPSTLDSSKAYDKGRENDKKGTQIYYGSLKNFQKINGFSSMQEINTDTDLFNTLIKKIKENCPANVVSG